MRRVGRMNTLFAEIRPTISCGTVVLLSKDLAASPPRRNPSLGRLFVRWVRCRVPTLVATGRLD